MCIPGSLPPDLPHCKATLPYLPHTLPYPTLYPALRITVRHLLDGPYQIRYVIKFFVSDNYKTGITDSQYISGNKDKNNLLICVEIN